MLIIAFMRNDVGVAAARALEPVLSVFREVEMQALVGACHG